jgi:hypothetical protein
MFVLIVVEDEFDETIVPKPSAHVPASGAHVTYFSAQTSTVPKAPNTPSQRVKVPNTILMTKISREKNDVCVCVCVCVCVYVWVCVRVCVCTDSL